MADKLTDAITIKISPEMHRELRIAEAYGMSESEFARVAIQEKLNSARAMYEALHAVFRQPKDDMG